jgi:hypothetical protein
MKMVDKSDRKSQPDDLLGLTAEFDVKSGYLLVEGEGVLGKQHRGVCMCFGCDLAVYARHATRELITNC